MIKKLMKLSIITKLMIPVAVLGLYAVKSICPMQICRRLRLLSVRNQPRNCMITSCSR